MILDLTPAMHADYRVLADRMTRFEARLEKRRELRRQHSRAALRGWETRRINDREGSGG